MNDFSGLAGRGIFFVWAVPSGAPGGGGGANGAMPKAGGPPGGGGGSGGGAGMDGTGAGGIKTPEVTGGPPGTLEF